MITTTVPEGGLRRRRRSCESIVFVCVRDITKMASAEAVFGAVYDGDRQITRIIPVQGEDSLDELVEWF